MSQNLCKVYNGSMNTAKFKTPSQSSSFGSDPWYNVDGGACGEARGPAPLDFRGLNSRSLNTSPDHKPKKAQGICSVCHSVRQLHNKDGTVHLHGPRAKPCLGSRQPPLSGASQTLVPASDYRPAGTPGPTQQAEDEPGVVNGLDTTDPIRAEQTGTMNHPSLARGLLRHIPRGARSVAGHLLTDIMESILRDPLEAEGWRRLLTFGAGVLESPSRGGRRRNLTLQIKKRVAVFRDGWSDLASTLFSSSTSTIGGRGRPVLNVDRSRAAAVAAKLEDGNISAAARILCSDETPAPVDEETLEILRQKHPAPPPDRSAIPRPTPSTSFQTTEAEVRARIRSFPMGSSGGPDGLRPQHVAELINDQDAGPGLLRATTAFINLLLDGVCPSELRSIFFGGTLFALRKSSGGLRPIAIGYVWRRLASKCANAYAIPRVTPHLTPRQLGVGVPGGCEAAVHATRRFMKNMDSGSVVVKLDISNAFNSLHRDRMLKSVDEFIPELAAYCHLAYADATTLQFGKFTILSQEGPQQGDPLGPLLFCLPLHSTLTRLQSPLAFGYLDDLTLGGSLGMVEADVDLIERECAGMGLRLNRAKCEIITADLVDDERSTLSQFTRVDPSTAMLLGAPLLSAEALLSALDIGVADLERAVDRLEHIARQDALLILRFSLGSPKMIYTLRCTDCYDHPRLKDYDGLLRRGIERILNVELSDIQWAQASLPIRMGGLGIRRVSSLALPAFLASAAGTLPIQSLILGTSFQYEDSAYASARSHWLQIAGTSNPVTVPDRKQSHWDEPLLQEVLSSVSDALREPYDQARLRAVQAPHASDWLHALPIAAYNLRLSDEAVRVAAGLRLGLAVCEPHTCVCGALVSTRGSHGLSCSLGFGRHARHTNINDIICRGLNRAGIPAVKEPSGLTRSDGKRPDGQTLIPWRSGRALLWDATVVNTVAASYIPATAAEAGGAAELAAKRKHVKYSELEKRYIFVPVAVETLGPLNNEGLDFISELGRRLTLVAGDIRETGFLFQSLSVTVQRFNAVAIQGTMSKLPDVEERRHQHY
jgi:Reverse transcriptase (RNA-dependent DNA polymerase)